MRAVLVLVLVFSLSGCVAYPWRHASSAEYRFTFSNETLTKVSAYLGADDKAQCENAKQLRKEDNTYVLPREYAWIRVHMAFTATYSSKLFLCVLDDSNKQIIWEKEIYFYSSLEPDEKRFLCALQNFEIECSETKT